MRHLMLESVVGARSTIIFVCIRWNMRDSLFILDHLRAIVSMSVEFTVSAQLPSKYRLFKCERGIELRYSCAAIVRPPPVRTRTVHMNGLKLARAHEAPELDQGAPGDDKLSLTAFASA